MLYIFITNVYTTVYTNVYNKCLTCFIDAVFYEEHQ
jgi:hypothetical protein